MDFSVQVKHTLFSIIDEMNEYRWLFTKTPGKDFSREKKWSFHEMIKFMISMESRSLKDELLHYFDFDVSTPSNSSFNQRRSQILPEAFAFLFHEFNSRFPESRFWHGLHLVACDGSDLNIYRNPDDPDNYFPNGPDNKGFSQLHLNALYDLCTRRYVDAVIQPGVKNNECRAMTAMIDRYAGSPSTVFIADRGYESYNVFAHAQEKGVFYLVRARDSENNSIIGGLRQQLPHNDEYDVLVPLKLTRKQTKEVKEHPEIYKFFPKNSTMDYIDLHENKYYDITLRIVRFKLADETYECLITNLPQEDYSKGTLKELYAKRWGIMPISA